MVSALILSAYLLLSSFSDSSTIQKKVIEQSGLYVQQLEMGIDPELNIWALNQLSLLNCEALEIVKSDIRALPEYSGFFQNLQCETIEESELQDFAHSYWPEEQKRLYQYIISQKEPLIPAILDYKDFPLVHLKLLMSGEYDIYYSSEYLNKAIEVWSSQIDGYSQPENLQYALTVSNLIWAAYRANNYSIIQKYYELFLDSEYLPLSSHKLRIVNAIDYVFYVLGHYDKSLQIQRNYSLPFTAFAGDENGKNQILLRHGVYLYALGKFQESKNIYESLYRESGEDDFFIFTNLAINNYMLGHSNKYLSMQLKALEHDTQNYKNLLTVYRNLFWFYSNANDINTALSYIDRAKEVAAENSDTTELALINSYLGTFYWSTSRNQKKALYHLTLGEEILSVERNYAKYVDLQIEKGIIYTKIDSLDKAKLTLEKVKQLAFSKSDTPQYIDALVNLTIIDLKQRNLVNASKNLEEIKLHSLDNLDFQLLTKYYTVKAQYQYLSGDIREAMDELQPVIVQVIERAKNNTDSQEGYWSVEDEYLDAFTLMTELLIESDRHGEALLLLDQLKTINDASLYNNPLVKASKLSEEDLAEEKRLNQRLQSLRKQYLNANEEKRFALRKEISLASAEREQILAQVNLSRDEAMPPLWAIQRGIQPHELVLHFTEIGNTLYISYLTADNARIRTHNFPPEMQDRFNAIADELASGQTNLDHLHELYQLLDLDDIPSDIRKISVIPDNYLYRIPLEILPTHKPDSPISYGSTHYLIEDYKFRYFTSLREFNNNRRGYNISTAEDFSGFAISNFENFSSQELPSLPFATIETNNILSILTSFQNKNIYTENDATKSSFKQQVGSSRIVHVATHSEVSEQDPLFSTIYLMNSNPEDTLESDQALYAYELFDTPLNSELIMLNSCSSGSGSYIQGSGVMGISRALRYAGAKSLALNLWSVNDKVASEFAADFYHYLNQGVTKNEALRLAKLNQLKLGNANPHFWGAYLMIGNPSPVTKKPANSLLLFSVLAVTLLLAGYTTLRKEDKLS